MRKPGGLLILSTPNLATSLEQRLAIPSICRRPWVTSRGEGRKGGEYLGAELVQVLEEPRRANLEDVSARTRQNAFYKLIRSFTRFSTNFAYRITGEPGPGILAVYRRARSG